MKEKFEYPDHLVPKFERAKKLEWFSIFYILSSTVVTYITMGNSQTMKTAWLEDALSLAPPISFLIASRLYLKPGTKNFLLVIIGLSPSPICVAPSRCWLSGYTFFPILLLFF